MGSIATKTFILLLTQSKTLNFIQATKISLGNVLFQGNRQEFHHIFPKAYLKSFCSIDMFDDDYQRFIKSRAESLLRKVEELLQ